MLASFFVPASAVTARAPRARSRPLLRDTRPRPRPPDDDDVGTTARPQRHAHEHEHLIIIVMLRLAHSCEQREGARASIIRLVQLDWDVTLVVRVAETRCRNSIATTRSPVCELPHSARSAAQSAVLLLSSCIVCMLPACVSIVLPATARGVCACIAHANGSARRPQRRAERCGGTRRRARRDIACGAARRHAL